MAKYYAQSNLKHDGVDYEKGAEVEIDEERGEALAASGVLGAEKPEGVRQVEPSEEREQGPEVGGEPAEETGEPTLDGRNESTGTDISAGTAEVGSNDTTFTAGESVNVAPDPSADL